MNAAEYLLRAGRDDKVAIESWDERITYGELRDAIARAAGVWRGLGLERGQRVLVLAPDSIDWVIAHFGAIWAGGVGVGLNSRLFERELAVVLRDSGASFIWCEGESASVVERLTGDAAPGLTPVPSERFSSLLRDAKPLPPESLAPTDPALWIYTSGTTGKPKAVMHAQQMVLGATEFLVDVLGAGPDEKLYASSKLFFAYSFANSLCAGLGLGATIVLDREWPTAERVASVVARHEPTTVFSVPTLYLKLLQGGIAPKLRGVRHFISAGEALPAQVAQAWREATSVTPVNAFGASETLVLVLYCDDEDNLLTLSPRVEVRPREPVPEPGAPHRLWLRHGSLALGYWQRPEAEEDAFADGWFSPGDLFRQHPGGRWEYCGRDDDMVKISGQWVSTVDVERALLVACGDSVKELAALGFRNAVGLVSIAVFAVERSGDGGEARARLTAGIESLPKLKQPREVRWVDELPRSDTGKLQRRVLREQLQADSAPTARSPQPRRAARGAQPAGDRR